MSLVTKYNIGHFEGKDHIAEKSDYIHEDGSLVWTRFTAVDPEHHGNSVAFDQWGRLIMVITPKGTITYRYIYSEEDIDQISDFPRSAKHDPNLGEMFIGLLIAFLGDLGG